jgi:NAD(P)-dependent dehydrogenase (short-subunit alcohol dehydrogenase family)
MNTPNTQVPSVTPGKGLDLAGSRILVVGAGQGGLGEAVVRLLVAEGAHVAGFDIDEGRLKGTLDGVSAGPGKAIGRIVDATDPAAMQAALDDAEAEIGPMDGMVHVVGGNHREWWHPIEQFPLEQFDEVLRINFRAALVGAQVVGARMLERRSGSIVFVSSISSLQGMAYAAAYAVAKAGINSLVQTMALELGQAGVRVNAIAPGTIVTIQSPDGEDETTREAVPLRRRGRPDDIAAPILFMLSPLANFVSGQVLAVDGGCMARPSYVDNEGLPVFIKNQEFRTGLMAQRRNIPNAAG